MPLHAIIVLYILFDDVKQTALVLMILSTSSDDNYAGVDSDTSAGRLSNIE